MHTVLKAMNIQRAKNLGVYRAELDFGNAQDNELLIQGSNCDRGKWNDSCGCIRSFRGIHSLMSSTIGYIDYVSDEWLKQQWMTSKFVVEWDLDYNAFKELVTYPELSYDAQFISLVQVVGGKPYEPVIKTTSIRNHSTHTIN